MEETKCLFVWRALFAPRFRLIAEVEPDLAGVDEAIARPADDARQAAAARVRLTVWCRKCRIVGARNAATRSSPTPPRWPPGCGAETPLLDWRERLVCSRRGRRQVDLVVSGGRRRCAASRSAATAARNSSAGDGSLAPLKPAASSAVSHCPGSAFPRNRCAGRRT
jgi:hypothetical protein